MAQCGSLIAPYELTAPKQVRPASEQLKREAEGHEHNPRKEYPAAPPPLLPVEFLHMAPLQFETSGVFIGPAFMVGLSLFEHDFDFLCDLGAQLLVAEVPFPSDRQKTDNIQGLPDHGIPTLAHRLFL